MRELSCNVIQDLLPLYVDEVVTEDTAELVRDHLRVCGKCCRELDRLRQPVSIPMDAEAQPIRKLAKRWRQDKIKTALIAVLCTVAILAAILGGGLWYTRPRPLPEVVGLQDADPSALSVVMMESIFTEEGFTGWNNWRLETAPGDEAYDAILTLLDQGAARASLRNVLGARSPIVGPGGDVLLFNFATGEADGVSFHLYSDGRLYLCVSGFLTYTQTNEGLYSALHSIVEACGSPIE